MNFQGVMIQLAPRVTVRQTNLGIQLRTLTGSSYNREIRADAYGCYYEDNFNLLRILLLKSSILIRNFAF